MAESCTGGLVSDLMTNMPGISRHFLAGLVTYSNSSKIELLGVSAASIESYGAVSEEVAVEMARGVRLRVGADIGAAVTGIAGPGGGTPEKPVGLVYLAVDDGQKVVVERDVFGGGRLEVKRSSAERLISMVVALLK